MVRGFPNFDLNIYFFMNANFTPSHRVEDNADNALIFFSRCSWVSSFIMIGTVIESSDDPVSISLSRWFYLHISFKVFRSLNHLSKENKSDGNFISGTHLTFWKSPIVLSYMIFSIAIPKFICFLSVSILFIETENFSHKIFRNFLEIIHNDNNGLSQL